MDGRIAAGRAPYILLGCGASGREILEGVRQRVSKNLVTVYVNTQNLNMEELDNILRSTDMVFLFCGAWDSSEIIAAGVICELCRSNGTPVIGITMMSSSGAYSGTSSENLVLLKDYINNLIVLDHHNIVHENPEIADEHAVNLTHQLIGKLITETADIIDTISTFELEDVWSYREV